ncbi:MAG: D-alanyl-D-alanine carboxypeptidase family protein [Candidatus Dormibacteria bacterium]
MPRLLIRLLLAGVLVAAAATAGTLAAARIRASAPPLAPTLHWRSPWAAAPGTPASISPPPGGSLAVAAVAGNAVTPLASADAHTIRPIASVTKTMTALVILEVHPLSPGQDGPTLTMTQRDVQDYRTIAASGGSYAPVTLGERLSERDLLLGLMLPSANNLALTAARWIDGSVAAFVHRLNLRAAAIGMVDTHFADPDGLDPDTTSTAADLVLLGARAVGDAALVSVVSTAAATLPDGTVVQNLDLLLGGDPGWLGVKTGWTPAAGGCLLFAARRSLAPGAPPLTVVGAVLGQPPDGSVDPGHPELGGAFAVARAAVDTGFAGFVDVRVGPGTVPVSGKVFGAWGTASGLHLEGPDMFVLLRLGQTLSVRVSSTSLLTPRAAGAAAGTVSVSLGDSQVGTWTLATDRRLEGPSPWWKLLNG